jgi:hypothetical protein
LENIYIQGYRLTLVSADNNFMMQMKKGYQTDKRWSKLKADPEADNAVGDEPVKLSFILKDDLVWFSDRQNNRTRLRILCDWTLIANIFKST